jgi:stearoyl-CoA desaturase (delta-9 desaturase)
LELHPAISHVFRFWLWLTTSMVTREWVAVHRKHHAECETEKDPHSPQILGLHKVLLQGAELYRAEAERAETLDRYGRGTPCDWLERHLYTKRKSWGIGLMLIIDLALLGPIGLSVWGIQMIWIPLWAAGVINGLGHYIGYRTYATPDASTNIVPWGILIGGEELHNNHHAYPGSAKFSARRWEFDIGWFYIRLLELLRLARVKKVAPRPARITRKGLDYEAARAIVAARLQVLAGYRSRVLARVHKDELRRQYDSRMRGTLKAVRRLLVRDESLLDPEGRARLDAALEQSYPLRTVYLFRDRLQAIWSDSAANPDRLLRELQEWCREAEASGIEALREFSARMAGYRSQRR